MQEGYPADMAVSSLLAEVQDSEHTAGDQHEERDEPNEQSGLNFEPIPLRFQEPHYSGLGNLTNPYNSCFAAVALQLIIACEADLHLVEGMYYTLLLCFVILLRC